MARNVVRSEMPRGKSPSLTGPGSIAMTAPFNTPHDVGNGGIPVKVMESLGEQVMPKTSVGKTPGDSGAFGGMSAQGPTRSIERFRPPSK